MKVSVASCTSFRRVLALGVNRSATTTPPSASASIEMSRLTPNPVINVHRLPNKFCETDKLYLSSLCRSGAAALGLQLKERRTRTKKKRRRRRPLLPSRVRRRRTAKEEG